MTHSQLSAAASELVRCSIALVNLADPKPDQLLIDDFLGFVVLGDILVKVDPAPIIVGFTCFPSIKASATVLVVRRSPQYSPGRRLRTVQRPSR